MANHKSSVKRAKQDIKKSARNLSIKRSVRSIEKALRTAIANKDATLAVSTLKEFTSKVDKASKNGIYHAKTSARKVSRLASQVAKI